MTEKFLIIWSKFIAIGCAVIRITTSDKYMDRVNMYASFYVGIRQGGVPIEDMENEMEKAVKSPGSPNCVLNASNAH